MSTLHRFLCYSQTDLNTATKGTECPHYTGVYVTVKPTLIQPPKGQSVHITEVTVLQSNLLNTLSKGQCPNYRASLITDEPP